MHNAHFDRYASSAHPLSFGFILITAAARPFATALFASGFKKPSDSNGYPFLRLIVKNKSTINRPFKQGLRCR
jgi:hypothetical protein